MKSQMIHADELFKRFFIAIYFYELKLVSHFTQVLQVQLLLNDQFTPMSAEAPILVEDCPSSAAAD